MTDENRIELALTKLLEINQLPGKTYDKVVSILNNTLSALG